MPHSESPQGSPARDHDEEILPDAPTAEVSTEDKVPAARENQTTGVRLEDMFSDSEDDEEFPTSSAPNPKISIGAAVAE